MHFGLAEELTDAAACAPWDARMGNRELDFSR